MICFTDWLRRETLRQALNVVHRRLEQEVEVQRFAEFGRVSAGLLHELSTPLAAASLTLDQIKEQQHSPLLRQVRRDLRRLEKYIAAARNQLKSEGPKKDFSLTVAIHQVTTLLAGRADKANVRLLVNSLGSVRLFGDPIRFQQALSNLISNAIEAYEAGDCGPRRVKITVTLTDSTIVIAVTDNARGIQAGDIPRIFEPFYSTKQQIGRGIGLGLAVVKQNIEQGYGGKVEVESRLGEGTTFRLIIPLS